MPRFVYERIRTGQPMLGLFVVDDRMGIGQAIEELLIIETASEQGGSGALSPPVGKRAAGGLGSSQRGHEGRPLLLDDLFEGLLAHGVSPILGGSRVIEGSYVLCRLFPKSNS